MLYDGEIKFLKKSIEAIENKEMQNAHNHLIRAQDILTGLISGLNMDAGPIAENLFNLYEYMHNRLIEANLSKDTNLITEVLDMISELRETWLQILKPANTSNV